MNQCPHESESGIQTPLLLKYKFRDLTSCQEIGFDSETGQFIGDWEKYYGERIGYWKLRTPDTQDLTVINLKCFYYNEIHVIGSSDPIMINFNYAFDIDKRLLETDRFQTYQLPADCDLRFSSHFFSSIFNDGIRPVLQEYERHRDDWIPRVLVRLPDLFAD